MLTGDWSHAGYEIDWEERKHCDRGKAKSKKYIVQWEQAMFEKCKLITQQ